MIHFKKDSSTTQNTQMAARLKIHGWQSNEWQHNLRHIASKTMGYNTMNNITGNDNIMDGST
jgi:hypothetical protein